MNQVVIGKFISLKRKQKNLTQELEKQKNILYGIILILMGIALQALSYAVGGSDFKDFISGLLLGLSIGEISDCEGLSEQKSVLVLHKVFVPHTSFGIH